jgi:hypothetical protein
MGEYYRSSESRNWGRTIAIIGLTASLTSIVGNALSGGEYKVSGTVLTGADGKKYILPNNPNQPVYPDRQACIDDVNKHMDRIKKATGSTVNPSSVCQPVSQYHTVRIYRNGQYLGPIVSENDEWQSSDMVAWSPVRDGTFAATGIPQEHDIANAPKGSVEGEHTSTTVDEGGLFHFGGGGGEDDPHIVVHGE